MDPSGSKRGGPPGKDGDDDGPGKKKVKFEADGTGTGGAGAIDVDSDSDTDEELEFSKLEGGRREAGSGGDSGGSDGEAGGRGGDRGGNRGGDGEAGSGGGGDRSNRPLRTGEATEPSASDLVLVGKILGDAAHPPEFHEASGGHMVKAQVETWMTDLYRSSPWWIELPNVEDVTSVERRQVKVKAIPLGAPPTSSLVGVANGNQGRMRLEGMQLALFGSGGGVDGEDDDLVAWDAVSGTPPAWFANVWDKAKESTGDQLANEFKNAKVYVTRSQVLEEQRDWLLV